MVRPVHAGFDAAKVGSELSERIAAVVQSETKCHRHGAGCDSRDDALRLEALDVFSEISRDLAASGE